MAAPHMTPFGPLAAPTHAAEPLAEHAAAQRGFVDEGSIPGFVEVLLHQDEVVHYCAYGLADMESKVSFSESSLVRLFSMTKPITVVSLMRLVEAGKVNLDDPVTKYLPSFKNMVYVHHANQAKASRGDRRTRRGPSLRQLLMHTSGLSYGSFFGQAPKYACEKSYEQLVAAVDSGEVSSLEAFVERLSKLPLRFKPGERWEYSHGVDVLGRVMEVVSGKSLAEVVHEQVLEPLGMEDTGFAVPAKSVDRLSALYTPPKEGVAGSSLGRLDGGSASAWVQGHQCKVVAGGGFMGSCFKTSDGSSSVGGLVSTLKDYLRFVRMIAGRGKCPSTGRRILEESTVDSFFENWLPKKSVTNGQQRIKGWHTDGRGKMGWGPLGQVRLGDPKTGAIWMGGIAGTFFAVDREHEIVSLTLTQTTEQYDFYGERLWEAGQRASKRRRLAE